MEKLFVDCDRIENKFNLIKELATYSAEHYQLFDNNKADKLLKFFKDEILEECCEACGGAMCMDQCPVNKYLSDVKKALDKHSKK